MQNHTYVDINGRDSFEQQQFGKYWSTFLIFFSAVNF